MKKTERKKNAFKKTMIYSMVIASMSYAALSSAATINGQVISNQALENTSVEVINASGQVIGKTNTDNNGYYSLSFNSSGPLLIAAKINGLGQYLYSLYDPSISSIGNGKVDITPFTTTLVYSLAGDHALLSNMAENLVNHIPNLDNNISVINSNLNRLLNTNIFSNYAIISGDNNIYGSNFRYIDIPLYRECLDYNYMVNLGNNTMIKLQISNGKIVGYSTQILPVTNAGKYTSPNSENAETGLQESINDTPSGGLVYIPSGTYHLRSASTQSPSSFPQSYVNGHPIRIALTVVQPDITIAGSQTGKTVLRLGANQDMRLLTASPTATNTTLFDLGFDGNKTNEYTHQDYPNGNVVDYLVGAESSVGFTAQFTELYNSLEDGFAAGGGGGSSFYLVNSQSYNNGIGATATGPMPGSSASNGMGMTVGGVSQALIENDISNGNQGAGIWINQGSQNIEVNNDTFENNFVGGGVNITPLPGQDTPAMMMRNIYLNNDTFRADHPQGRYDSIFIANASNVLIYNPNVNGSVSSNIGGDKNQYSIVNTFASLPDMHRNTACYNTLSGVNSFTAVTGLTQKLSGGTTPAPASGSNSQSSSGSSFNISSITGILGLIAAGEASEDILKVGKVLNTGQTQQMTAEEKLRNQQTQEKALSQKELLVAQSKNNYLYDTAPISQLPAMCEQGKAAAANLQSLDSANIQGNSFNSVLQTESDPGVYNESTSVASQIGKVEGLSNLSGQQTDAGALFESKKSGEAQTVMATLLNPISSQPLTGEQASTPAGTLWMAKHNEAEVGLSVASTSMGFVSGLHAVTVPSSAVSAVASAAGVSSTASTASSPSITKVAIRAPSKSSTPPSSSDSADGDWQRLVPQYKDLIAQVAAQANISPAILAATIAHEDSTEDLKAMPCNNPVNYKMTNGDSSLHCPGTDYSAKSLGQMIDPTAISLGASYGLTNPLIVYGQHPKIELEAMAAGLNHFLSNCDGNVACAFGGWNRGNTDPAWMHKPLSEWKASSPTTAYAKVSMGFYTGKAQVNVNGYQGGTSSSGSAASTAGLLRLVSLGSYANPAFYKKLNKTTETGAWRVLLYLKATSMQVENQNRQLMERLSAIMATRESLALKSKIHQENILRGNAMSQYNR